MSAGPARGGALGAVLDAVRAPLALADLQGRLVYSNAAFDAAWAAQPAPPPPGGLLGDLLESLAEPGALRPDGPLALPALWQVRGGRGRGTTTVLAAAPDDLLLLEVSEVEDGAAGTGPGVERRAGQVLDVVLALSETLTRAEVTTVMTGRVGAALGSAGVLIALLDEDGLLSPLEVAGYSPTMLELIGRRLRDPGGAPMAAVRERRPAVFSSPDEYLARFPDREDLVNASGMQSWVYLPLIASGRVIGTWSVSYAEQRVTSPTELALLVTLAALCAQSLERARLYERERETSRVLQRAIAPDDLPVLPGVLLAAGYEAATAGNQVGGDFYDVRPLPNGRVLLVLGDVTGHDIAAAALMGQVRATLRAYAVDDRGPGSLLSRTNHLLAELDGCLVTCCALELDLLTGAGRLASAGHPPPLLTSSRGGARLLGGPGGPPLAATQAWQYLEATVLLEPGDLLLLYTDGLVESKDLSLDDGLARLVTAAGEARGTPEELVDHLVETLGSHRGLDDVALLALQRVPLLTWPT